MIDIRKISIGQDYKSDAMHYIVGQGSVYAFSTNSATGAATHGYIAVTYNSIPTTIGALAYQGGNIPLVSIRNS